MIPDYLYIYIYLILTTILCLTTMVYVSLNSTKRLLLGDSNSRIKSFILTTSLVLFLGFRPISPLFADTTGYASFYTSFQDGVLDISYLYVQKEYFWGGVIQFCSGLGIDVHVWFVLVAALSLFPVLFAFRKLFPQNEYLAMLLYITFFSFFSGMTNGIRNNMALSFVMLSMAYYFRPNRNLLIVLIFFLLAFFTHKSTILPILCLLAADTVLKNPRYNIVIWIASIFISLIFPGAFDRIFVNLDFDDRMANYIIAGKDPQMLSGFSHTGFRWDFLLFSAVPVLFGWIVIVKKKINDAIYNVIFNTYILANTFWILVIYAAFSNRFAGLSWAFYPIVIAYPLVKYRIFNSQRQIYIWLLAIYLVFCIYMNI